MKFLPYKPDQAWLLPPSVKDVLEADPLCFFVDDIVGKLDLSAFVANYSDEGQRPYAPQLRVKVWLYAYCLQMTSSRRLEQRLKEDLGFRYLAGGQAPDHCTLNNFRTRPQKALHQLFVQVLEVGRGMGRGRLGQVAVDSTGVRANASQRRTESVQELRQRLAATYRMIRRWQRQWAEAEHDEDPGTKVRPHYRPMLAPQWAETQEKLKKAQELRARQVSNTDADSRFLYQSGGQGFVLGYTLDLAVSDDHGMVAQGTTQAVDDSPSLLPLLDKVRETCGEWPVEARADSGFFSVDNLVGLETRGLRGLVPDPHRSGELQGHRPPVQSPGARPEHCRRRARRRSAAGKKRYGRRQALVEPVFGVLKEQRGLRGVRLRGLSKVRTELALACTAFNLTRMWKVRRTG